MSKLASELLSTCRRFLASKRSGKVDLSERLFANAAGHRPKLSEITDTHGPEFESGRNPYGPARTLRFIGLVLLALFLFELFISWLIPELYVPPFH
jgi:hypothetical protein